MRVGRLVVRGRKHDYQGTEHAVSTTWRGIVRRTRPFLKARSAYRFEGTSFSLGKLTILRGSAWSPGLIGRKQITLDDDVVNAKTAWIKEGSEHLRSVLPAFQ